jgi:Kef-type K+ transport system membrane component KefB
MLQKIGAKWRLERLAGAIASRLFTNMIELDDCLGTKLLITNHQSSYMDNSQLILAGVLVSLVVIYLASKIGGELCVRVNLPPVLGELLGGVIVGVSVLKLLIFPDVDLGAGDSLVIQWLTATAGLAPAAAQIVFERESESVALLAELGVIILLFEIGLESDLQELLRVGTQAVIVAIVGVVVPFALGTLGLIYLFHTPPIAAIFAGASLTATSIGITAKVLTEIGKLNTTEGQIIIGAAVVDDVLGIIILAVVAGLSQTGRVDVGTIGYLIFSATVFLVGAILLGRWLKDYFVIVVDRLQTRGQVLLVSLIFAFSLSYVAVAIHLEAILGAFAAGLILAETEKRDDILKQVQPVADLLVPVFFVVVGAKTDLSILNPAVAANREGLTIAIFLILAAIVGKVVTGAVIFGQPQINRLAVGVGMIPRGEVGLIFVSVGAASGAVSDAIQAGTIAMVIFTTFIAPPLLRLAFVTRSQPKIVK